MPQDICTWDPSKHDGKPCPHHHLGMRGGKYFIGNQEIDKDTYIELRKTHAHEDFDSDEPKSLEKLPRLEKELTPSEAMTSTNPMLNQYNSKDAGRQNNCQKCCGCFELRMRGYDVTAAPWNPMYLVKDGKVEGFRGGSSSTPAVSLIDAFGYGWKTRFDFCDFSYSYYQNGKATEYDRAKAAEEYKKECGKHEHFQIGNQEAYRLLSKGPKKVIEENLSNFPNSRWVVSVDWADTQGFRKRWKNGGHVFMACVDDKGKVKFYDPQTGKEPTRQSHWDKLGYQKYQDTECYRIDNRDFKEDFLDVFVYDGGKTDDDY